VLDSQIAWSGGMMPPMTASPRAVRRPADIDPIPRAELFAWFEELADREVQALQADQAPPTGELWTQLAVQARLESEITATRWLLVAHLLRAGTAESWWTVAEAIGMTNAEAARSEFVKWVTTQVDLYQQTASRGLTDDTAHELRTLAHELPLSLP
jgi:hypothetical protein